MGRYFSIGYYVPIELYASSPSGYLPVATPGLWGFLTESGFHIASAPSSRIRKGVSH
jgi:hypothetical protein